jgi:hypothetical protein
MATLNVQLTESEKRRAYNKKYYEERGKKKYLENTEGKVAFRKDGRSFDPEYVKAKNRDYRTSDIPRYLWTTAKMRAEKKGLEFNITPEDIVVPTHCPVLGIELTYGKKLGGDDSSFSIDRIDSSKGYVKGNVQVISKRANTIKNDSTLEELKALVAYLEKLDG